MNSINTDYTASSSRALKDIGDTTPATSGTTRDLNVLDKDKQNKDIKIKNNAKIAKSDCRESKRTSLTQFYKRDIYENNFERINRSEYLGISESISGSSDTYHCVHGPEGRKYTQKGLLKRNLLKELDPIPKDAKWEERCPPAYGWEMATRLAYLVTDPTRESQMDRIVSHLHDLAKTSANGFRIDILESLIVIVDYLVENKHKMDSLAECLVMLLKNMQNPILLNVSSDVVTYFETLRQFIGYLGNTEIQY